MDWRTTAEVLVIVVPLGLYFGFLGLVNIRRRPTVIGGRLDFLVVIVAFLPLLFRPVRLVLSLGGVAWQASILGGIGIVLWLLLPREFTSWVIYSVSEAEATRGLERILWRMRVPYTRRENRFQLDPLGGTLIISNMPLLRNVTVYLESTGETAFFERLGRELREELSRAEGRPSLSGHCFLAASASLFLAPLIWVLFDAPNIYAMLMRWLSAG